MRRGLTVQHHRRRPAAGLARRALLAACGALAVMQTGPSIARAEQTEGPLVFAAASMTDAVTEIADAFAAATGIRVRLSFAASSALARQIQSGAPAAIFVSANRAWMDHVEASGLIEPASRADVAGNRLALIAPTESDLPAEVAATPDLAGLLGDGRLAMGDPDHVPAGLYARQALEALGQWPAIAPRLARTGDVRGALALVARGEAPLGIVYATDAAISERVRVVALLPADSHPPIAYPAALVGDAGDDARAFLAFLRGAQAQAIFRARGFAPPPAAGLDPAA